VSNRAQLPSLLTLSSASHTGLKRAHVVLTMVLSRRADAPGIAAEFTPNEPRCDKPGTGPDHAHPEPRKLVIQQNN